MKNTMSNYSLIKFSINTIKESKKMTFLWIAFIVSTFLEALSYLTIPYIEKIIIDKLVIGKLGNINYLLISMMIFLVIHYTFQFFTNYLKVKMVGIVEIQLRENILKNLININKEFFIKTPIGKISNIIQKDTDIIVQFITSILPIWIYDICIILVLSSVLIFMNSYIYIAIMPIILLINYLNKLNKNKIKKYFIEHQDNYSNLNQHIYETIKGVDTIRNYGLSKYSLDKYILISNKCIESKVKLNVISTLLNGFTNFLLGLGNITIYIMGVYFVVNDTITIGDIFGFTSYYIRIKEPIFQLRTLSEHYVKAKESLDRVKQILNQNRYKCGKGNKITNFESIEFRNVKFGYNSSNIIIDNFNLKINKGDKIAIIGKSGIGKSTLKNLILNMYSIDSGEILINGIDIQNYDMDSWYKNISVVDQDVFLFNESIKFNIELNNCLDTIKLKKLINVCDLDILKEDNFSNTKTQIKDFGTNLSGGQKKRISLCRALAKDSEVYIFDELTSGLDIKTKEHIYKIFEENLDGKTCIYITHDLTELKYFNKVLNFDDMKIHNFHNKKIDIDCY
ncbi:ABC transporter ATP-binding protein [Clostridium perfringens]|uniref:ABC transporter ATP-binding protein n=1 Tax=Clostridium perfringens TaxID=1502 RepID=UPI0018E45EDE|nr:ABC transporter ATP-binding protein [Clostridium perfringens]MBI6039880.1 ABC transporter ATP-binding protein [Clostridium perfringens]